mmetsp:Transcript_11341/g.21629  ORF Transcript_11341/g.21629 Transcript_11341/m.21629 type:complete len:287 (-) Transcript_11341:127-987(-)
MEFNCFDNLPDDGLLALGSWVAATGLENFARCLKVCRRFRRVLGRPSMLKELIRERNFTDAPEIETLEHLALFDAIKQVGLCDENRIGFGYGSLTVARDADYHPRQVHHHPRRGGITEGAVLHSERRIADVARILTRFPGTFLRIESHCGTAAPPGIAEHFSAARGMSVVRAFLDLLSPGQVDDPSHAREVSIMERRLHLTSWGMQISTAAETSQHRYAGVARQGKGWAEVYICKGDTLEMPSRPEFYQGHERDPNELRRQLDEDEGTQRDAVYRGLRGYMFFGGW